MMQRVLKGLTRLCLLALLLMAMVIGGAALATHYVFQEPAQVTWSRYAMPEFLWQRQKYPSMRWAFDLVEPLIDRPDPREQFAADTTLSARDGPTLSDNAPVGPRLSGLETPGRVARATVEVATSEGLRAAVARARPGTVIEIQPGTYAFSGPSIAADRAGTAENPIVVRAPEIGSVRLKFSLLEGFHVTAPHWTFENLIIEGTCRSDTHCEHAFHVVGDAIGVVIRNNWVSNFNAAVKVNARAGRFPDDGLILRNAFVNDSSRDTDKPTTPLDIVAASRWRIQKNFIADFAKARSNRASYGAFFKGAGEDNIFEQNLVRCEWRHSGGIRIGFSFGDGGTGRRYCRDKRCTVEHRRGIVRNNVIMDCPNDVGIYLSRSADTKVYNNALINTRGIDVRHPRTSAEIVNNIIDGRILSRDGGSYSARRNIVSPLDAVLLDKVSDEIYRDPLSGDLRLKNPDAVVGAGLPVEDSGRDFCGQAYGDGPPDIGPLQYRPDMQCVPDFRSDPP